MGAARPRVSAREVRGFLERHGLAANRALGQNFLVDEGLAARLVELAGVQAADTVLEIGTGLGILTRALAARARRVVTIEVDAGIVRALREDALLPAGVELLHADVLEVDLAERARKLGAPLRLVANLPYSISAPVLRSLLDLRELLTDWSVMVQRDVALRLLAGPGSRDYGSLAVLHHLLLHVERKLDIAPHSFHPAPKVRSSFVRMRPRRNSDLATGELEWLERVVRAAFGQRRKRLANALRGGKVASAIGEPLELALAELGLATTVRAEQVGPEQFLALARRLQSGAA